MGLLFPPTPAVDAPVASDEVRAVMRHLEGPAYEPTVAVTPSGAILYSGATTAGRGMAWILRSTDDGATWTNATASLTDHTFEVADPYVYVDPDTGRIFRLTMGSLGSGKGCLKLITSDDDGATWTVVPELCISPPFHDHPSLVAGKPRGALQPSGYANPIHVCLNHLQGTMCAVSLDGAATFLPPTPAFLSVGAGGLCGGLNSPAVTDSEGRVYVPRLHCDVPKVARSEDGGITWVERTIPGPHASRMPFIGLGLGDAEPPYIDTNVLHMAVDASDALHVVYVAADGLPYTLWSRDQGDTWSEPRLIAAPGVTAGGKSLVTVAAGAAGHVAFAYVATGHPEGYATADWEGATWDAWIGATTDAFDSGAVAWSRANPADDPLGAYDCGIDRCMETTCEGICPGMYDYIDLALSADGRPWAALVDVCHETCAQTGRNDQARAALATLASGPSLTRPGEVLAPLAWAE